MNLVIVESPSKAKTINKYLGKDYVVKASKGHIVDLPKSGIAIYPEESFRADYVVTNKKALTELKKAYKDANELILAVDMDREGEAIGWHIAQKLGVIDSTGKPKKGKKLQRIVFNEISKDAIIESLKKPRQIDMNLVNAQQTRRFLDRLVGYKLSPVLWKKISFGLSAGRVQSVALRLVVDKENERNKFKIEEYWSVEVFIQNSNAKKTIVNIIKKSDDIDKTTTEKGVKFELFKINSQHVKLQSETEAIRVVDALKNKSILIKEINTKEIKKNPKPPFITSTLQQAGVNTLGFSAKRTMMAAQKLYELGFITYMRTDSTNLSQQAIEVIRSKVKKEFGSEYLPDKPNVYGKKSKNVQEAHEAIRPVDFNVQSDKSFTTEMQKVYSLILNRTLASQMKPAVYEQMQVIAESGKYQFKATGQKLIFPGYLIIKTLKDDDSIQSIESLVKDKSYHIDIINSVQHFTQPPARYTEASLIKKLEELGVGRPSTYSSIISTIISRKYVNKEGKILEPTDIGIAVSNLLSDNFKNIVDYGFTSKMEEGLDNIAEGKVDWLKFLKEFYFPFEKEIKEKEVEISRDDYKVLGQAPADISCPVCESPMIIKLGRFGRFYSCSKWPDCKGMLSITGESENDLLEESKSEEFLSRYLPAPKTEDGRDFILKNGRYGKFWAHPDYPKVKDARPLEMTPEEIEKQYGKPPVDQEGTEYTLRSGKFGRFWAHPDYPKVKKVIRIAKEQNN